MNKEKRKTVKIRVPLSRRAFLKTSVGLAAVACAGLGYPAVIEPRRFEITRRRLVLPSLPRGLDGLKIVHLTDLHRSRYVSQHYLRSAMAAANALEPDIIAFTGDYLTHSRIPKREWVYGDAAEADNHMAEVAACMAQARARHGVFATLGNHDHWYGAERCTRSIEQVGIPVLRNRSVTLTIRGESLPILGMGDLWTEGMDFARAFTGVAAPFSLVLMHNPDGFEDWPQPGAHLILAGHTHGGQVDLPVFGPPLVPSRYGQKYAQGLFQKADSLLYVNRGLGTIFPPVRLNCRPEIALLELACG